MDYILALPTQLSQHLGINYTEVISVCINLIIQVSHIPGHEIHIVSYALWDGGDL